MTSLLKLSAKTAIRIKPVAAAPPAPAAGIGSAEMPPAAQAEGEAAEAVIAEGAGAAPAGAVGSEAAKTEAAKAAGAGAAKAAGAGAADPSTAAGIEWGKEEEEVAVEDICVGDTLKVGSKALVQALLLLVICHSKKAIGPAPQAATETARCNSIQVQAGCRYLKQGGSDVIGVGVKAQGRKWK